MSNKNFKTNLLNALTALVCTGIHLVQLLKDSKDKKGQIDWSKEHELRYTTQDVLNLSAFCLGTVIGLIARHLYHKHH